MNSADTTASAGQAPVRRTSIPGNFIRGALIGTVETVPGVSGGTVALVVGIYQQIIDSASHVVSAGRRLITGPDRAVGFKEHMAAVHWKVVIPVVIAMFVAVVTVAGPMADAVETYPEHTRAVFFGMVLASIAVPLRMVRDDLRAQAVRSTSGGSGSPRLRRLPPSHIAAAVVACIATAILVSLPPTSLDPNPLVLIPAAMVAVSALILPGLSGSFLLLTFGLYEPTLRAVEAQDLSYLGVFFLGAVLGLIVIVNALKWLLEHKHTITLLVLAGVMTGALRTLWPWQDENRGLQAPGDEWPAVLALGLAGFLLVSLLVIVDAKLVKKQAAEQ